MLEKNIRGLCFRVDRRTFSFLSACAQIHTCCPQCFHHRSSLRAISSGHDGNKGMSVYLTNNGQSCSRISRSKLHHRLSVLQLSGFFGIEDQLLGNAVLLGEPWIQVFQFGQYLAFGSESFGRVWEGNWRYISNISGEIRRSIFMRDCLTFNIMLLNQALHRESQYPIRSLVLIIICIPQLTRDHATFVTYF